MSTTCTHEIPSSSFQLLNSTPTLSISPYHIPLLGFRVGTLNVGTLNGKFSEIVEMFEGRHVDVWCIQEVS